MPLAVYVQIIASMLIDGVTFRLWLRCMMMYGKEAGDFLDKTALLRGCRRRQEVSQPDAADQEHLRRLLAERSGRSLEMIVLGVW